MKISLFTFILTFLCFCVVLKSNAQYSNISQNLVTHKDGVDLYPVYKSFVKGSYIDSIIYNGPLIIFCVSFEKAATDTEKFRLEAINSNQSWVAGTSTSGYKRPIKIKNILRNGQLIKNELTSKPLNISLKSDGESKTIKISCQFYFWRHDFKDSNASILKSIDQINFPSNNFQFAFKAIRIRRSNFTKPLYASIVKNFEEDYFLNSNEHLRKRSIEINDQPIRSFPVRPIGSEKQDSFKKINYQVLKIAENCLFLEGVVHTEHHTIFKVKFYEHSSFDILLHNTFGQRYFIKSTSKNIPMKYIRNIKLNNVLILEELEKKETIRFKNNYTPFYITYEIWFDRIPEDLKNFNLIEGTDGDVLSFNIYSINTPCESRAK